MTSSSAIPAPEGGKVFAKIRQQNNSLIYKGVSYEHISTVETNAGVGEYATPYG